MTPTEEQKRALAVVYEMTRGGGAHAKRLHVAVKDYVAAEFFGDVGKPEPEPSDAPDRALRSLSKALARSRTTVPLSKDEWISRAEGRREFLRDAFDALLDQGLLAAVEVVHVDTLGRRRRHTRYNVVTDSHKP